MHAEAFFFKAVLTRFKCTKPVVLDSKLCLTFFWCLSLLRDLSGIIYHTWFVSPRSCSSRLCFAQAAKHGQSTAISHQPYSSLLRRAVKHLEFNIGTSSCHFGAFARANTDPTTNTQETPTWLRGVDRERTRVPRCPVLCVFVHPSPATVPYAWCAVLPSTFAVPRIRLRSYSSSLPF